MINSKNERSMLYLEKKYDKPKHDAMMLWLEDNLEEKLNFIKRFVPELEPKTGTKLKKWHIELEFPVKPCDNYIGGYADMVVVAEYYNSPLSIHIIEIKPSIRSQGDTIRQIRKYHDLSTQNDSFGNVCSYLFTFDDKWDTTFTNQGVMVLHPPEGVSLQQMINDYL